VKSANNIEVKRINKNRVFRFVNQQEKVSRPEIAAALNLSGPTVLQIVKELLEDGLFKEVGEFNSTGGRKAKAVAPVHDARFAVGLDITRNHISIVLSNLSGKILKHTRINRAFEPTNEYYKENGRIIQQFIADENISPDKILGVGISVPGIVNSEKNEMNHSYVLGAPHISCIQMNEFIPYPCIMVNDANAAGVTERRYDGRNATIIYLSLSNSVGGAIFSWNDTGFADSLGRDNRFQNSIYVGEHWRGAEFGHMTLFPGGKECYCGKRGCVDGYCSAYQLSKHTDGKLDVFFNELENGNVFFKNIWENYLEVLAVVVNNLRMVFDCDIILGGYVGSYMEKYLTEFRSKVATLDTFSSDASFIKPCRYQVEASALGATLYYIDSFIDTI
jgi:predicted NBD/HSP70 family sugar kinase